MKIITSGGQTTEIPEAIKMCNNTHRWSFKSFFFLRCNDTHTHTIFHLNVNVTALIFVLQTSSEFAVKKSNLGTYELNRGGGGEPGKIFNHLPVKNEGALLIFRVNEVSHPELSTLGLTDTCWRQRGPLSRAGLRGACEGSPGACGSGEGASERGGEKTGRASRCSSRPPLSFSRPVPPGQQASGVVRWSAAMQKRSPPLLPAQLVPADA